MSRAATILGRFPMHFEATRPGKLLGSVVTALSRDLDVQFGQIGAVRRAHRVREAETVQDLLRLGALHDIRPQEVEILSMRLRKTLLAIGALEDAAPADQPAAIEDLLALWALEIVGDPLDAFTAAPALDAPAPGAQEVAATALAVLGAAARTASSYTAQRQAVSRRIISICDTHARGNGTVRALLYGAANALDLDIISIAHSNDRYVHAAQALDRLALVPDSASDVAPPVPQLEVFGLEENPLRRAKQAPSERRHTECFEILRKGFEPARMEISITPNNDRGVGPMVVNRDQGRGVGYAHTIPAGQTLVFSENGRATIGGTDVTAFAYGFEGAVFADADNPAPSDPVFDTTPFVVTTPPGALDRDAGFPHAGLSVPMPDVAVGKTRMAFFVQEGHFGLAANPPERHDDLIVTPRPAAGFFAGPGAPLGSVFAPSPVQTRDVAALVSFAWSEREAYKVRVLIPPRFRSFSDDPEGNDVTARVTQALERFRPAGIAIETAFIDDRWILGDSVLNDEFDENDALIALSGGMVLWPSPAEEGPSGPSIDI